jgi:hypothetical protein
MDTTPAAAMAENGDGDGHGMGGGTSVRDIMGKKRGSNAKKARYEGGQRACAGEDNDDIMISTNFLCCNNCAAKPKTARARTNTPIVQTKPRARLS